MSDSNEPKIYLLPNLMTAGNLFCGFAAVLRIIEAALAIDNGSSGAQLYHEALLFILGACVFDLLDGRLARLGGHESPFGREFDSLADLISFGIAPALLVYQMVLRDIGGVAGWLSTDARELATVILAATAALILISYYRITQRGGTISGTSGS